MSRPQLIESSPEAQTFLSDIHDRVKEYLLYPEERFSKYAEAVLAGTSRDLQEEARSLNDLNGLVERIREKPFWVTVKHDPTIHPVGRVIDAKVFQVPNSEEYFVAGLLGEYDRTTLPTIAEGTSKSGSFIWTDDERAQAEGKPQLAFSIHEMPFDLIQEMIAVSPESVDHRVLQERRKEFLSLIILKLILPTGFLFGMAKKFGEKLVEHSADDIFKWVKSAVLKRLSDYQKEVNRTTLFLFESYYKGCTIEFVISSFDDLVQVDSVEGIPEAMAASITLVNSFESQQPTRLVFEYDIERKKWIPLYIVTNRGIYTNRPYLQLIPTGGLSLSSRSDVDSRTLPDAVEDEQHKSE